MIPNLVLKMGLEVIPKENLKKLFDVAHLVAELSGRPHIENMPYVGDYAFAHKGGVHVSAIKRDPRTYEHIPPELVGNRRIISISELSGKSNVLEKIKEMGFEIDESSPKVREILERIKELEAQGYHFEGAEASFELLVREMLGIRRKYFEFLGFTVMTVKNRDEKSFSEATVKVRVPDEVAERLGTMNPSNTPRQRVKDPSKHWTGR